MHDAHLALSELALILLRDVVHDHVLDELSLRLSKLHLTVCYAEVHRDRSCDRLCGNELRLLCAAQRSAELLGDHHPGTNGRNLDDHDLLEDGHYLDDRDPLEDDPLNHHGYKTVYPLDHRDLLKDDHCLDDLDLLVDDLLNHHDHTTDDHRDRCDHRDLLKDGHCLDDRDLLVDDLLNHHGYKTVYPHDHRDLLKDDHCLDDRDLLVDDLLNHHDHTTDDHRDLLVDDRDLGHHFDRMQDGLLDDYPDGMGARHDLLTDGRDCPKDDPGPRLVCLNDRQHHRHRRDALDAKVCQILLPVADDVDRDFQGLALDEVYLQSTAKHRTYARW
jgi:hypothetical protein